MTGISNKENGIKKKTNGIARTITSQLSVETIESANVTTDSADLTGELVDLGGATSADVNFEYRPVGGSFTETAVDTLSSPQQFTDSISNLNSNSDYEFRALATDSNGGTDEGALLTFTTSQTQVIEDFESTDLSEYTFKTTGGGEAQRTDSIQYEGSWSMNLRGTSGSNKSLSLLPADTSGTTPDRGDTFTVRMQTFFTDTSLSFFFFLNGSYNGWRPVGYEAELDAQGSDSFRINRVDSSSSTSISPTATVDWSNHGNDWVEIEIVTDTNDNITAKAFSQGGSKLAEVSATDGTYTDNGYGFGHKPNSNNKGGYYDYLVQR